MEIRPATRDDRSGTGAFHRRIVAACTTRAYQVRARAASFAAVHIPLIFRPAVAADLARIVELIADDTIAAPRTGGLGDAHRRAFEAIDADPNNELIVVESEGRVIGTMQLTYIPGISRHGATRLLIEAVRVDSALRGQGIGTAMMNWAHQRGRARGCALAQLTSDKHRPAAHRFYRALGYQQSHEGFKLPL